MNPYPRPDREGDDMKDSQSPPRMPSNGHPEAEPSAAMGFHRALSVAQRGLEAWKVKPHNARWWRHIDGTPIPNDLLVNIAEAFAEESAK